MPRHTSSTVAQTDPRPLLAQQYITQTFTLAAPNLSINGFDLDAKTFPAVYLSDPTTTNSAAANTRSSTQSRHEIIQYEPFDARKRTRLEELAREEEDLMREVASLKRSVPGAAARSYAEGFWEGVRADEAGFEGAKTRAAVVGGGEEEEEDGDGKKEKKEKEKKKKTLLLEGLGEVERVDDVEKGYAGVVETLGRLKREMPATVAKMERARVAGEYVVTEK